MEAVAAVLCLLVVVLSTWRRVVATLSRVTLLCRSGLSGEQGGFERVEEAGCEVRGEVGTPLSNEMLAVSAVDCEPDFLTLRST